VVDQFSDFAVGGPLVRPAPEFVAIEFAPDGLLRLTLTTEAGFDYTIQSCTALGAAAWDVEILQGEGTAVVGATAFRGTGLPMTLLVKLVSQTRFYRAVRQEPP
jgi:hypothetical protein